MSFQKTARYLGKPDYNFKIDTFTTFKMFQRAVYSFG